MKVKTISCAPWIFEKSKIFIIKFFLPLYSYKRLKIENEVLPSKPTHSMFFSTLHWPLRHLLPAFSSCFYIAQHSLCFSIETDCLDPYFDDTMLNLPEWVQLKFAEDVVRTLVTFLPRWNSILLQKRLPLVIRFAEKLISHASSLFFKLLLICMEYVIIDYNSLKTSTEREANFIALIF